MSEILHHLKVEQYGDELLRHRVYVDGKELKGVVAVDYHASVNEVPTATITRCNARGIDSTTLLHMKYVSDREAATEVVLRECEWSPYYAEKLIEDINKVKGTKYANHS